MVHQPPTIKERTFLILALVKSEMAELLNAINIQAKTFRWPYQGIQN